VSVGAEQSRGLPVSVGAVQAWYTLTISRHGRQTDSREEFQMSQPEAFYSCVAPGIVRRADRGLCLAGKRVTLYLIMDYLTAGWPPHLIRHWLDLTW
jgi:hypothetical protein